jgi:hypothetical protein
MEGRLVGHQRSLRRISGWHRLAPVQRHQPQEHRDADNEAHLIQPHSAIRRIQGSDRDALNSRHNNKPSVKI